MPDPDQIETSENSALENLRTRVDSTAVQIVLGNPGHSERLQLMQSIGEEAERCGQEEVAKIIRNAIGEASKSEEDSTKEDTFSDCLVHVQQSLLVPKLVDSSKPESPEATLSASSLAEDRELIGDFILEARDHLAQVEHQMITLEKSLSDAEAINTVFRAFHTIKGLAGFLSLDSIRAVAHETETLLDLVRNRRLRIIPAIVDVVLAASDFLKASLVHLEQGLCGGSAAPAPQMDALLVRIQRAASEEATDCRSSSSAPEAGGSSNGAWDGVERRRTSEDRRAPGSEAHSVKVDTAKLEIKDGPLVCFQRPAVDVLFHSVSEAAGPSATAAILTGMGSDGVQGLLAMKRAGARTLVQDERSCVVFGMPKEAAKVGAVDRVLPLSEIGGALLMEATRSSK